MKKTFKAGLILLIALINGNYLLGQGNTEQYWKPVADNPYLQERREVIPTDKPIDQVAILDEVVYTVKEGKLFFLQGQGLVPVKGAPEKITKIEVLKGGLWVSSNSGLYLFDDKKWAKISAEKFVDFCMHLNQVHVATTESIFKYEDGKLTNIMPEGGYLSSDVTMFMEDGTQLLADPVTLGPITAIESYSQTLHILQPGKLVQLAGKVVNEHLIDWGNLPSNNTNDLLSIGSKLYISTDRGLGLLRGTSLTQIKGTDGLPVENTAQMVKGFDSDIWIGTPRGLIRMTADEFHYFGSGLWLPDNKVNGIASTKNKVVAATEGGLGIIHYEPYTLQKKAAHYEQWMEAYGHKRMGFTHLLSKRNGEWFRDISDNDGAHTATYLAAMSYKYAVTGDEADREEALDAFQAMLFLERVTPIDGLISRAVFSRKGDPGTMDNRGSGGLPAKWYATADSLWYWKGDASSDEVIAHYYSVAIFHDLVAKGKEKELAKEHMTRMTSYIMDNGWKLIDADGETTRWGRWNPEYLLRPYGYEDRGINGLEVLAFTYATYALTGEEKYKKGYDQLVKWGYPENTIKQKKTFPPSQIAPWDDNLALESYMILLPYEKDPDLRSTYLRSLERTFEIKRMEKIPWFNFTYAALTGNDADLGAATQHLREWPLDCTNYSYNNSHRDDLFVEKGYISYEGGVKAISPREVAALRESRRAIVLDGGRNGNRIMEPTGYLRDYWKGRYYGFIKAPTVTDKNLLTVEKFSGKNLGAKPYDGTERPDYLK
ncbi:hypothetical protein [Cyclobacterium marinum]|uniref:hypothetical protein n=1 Tax=Cyclobacterium marinum TaxID=104 RepID=UPI0011F06581|nr:hypothetical protein [Cyclobacterium marinum]MBI0397405.1 hypothetical protein [Cyclobacterium marinum]